MRQFGPGIGPILLDNVHCGGYENKLLDCPHLGIEVESCVHYQDIGVVCKAGTELTLIYTYMANYMVYFALVVIGASTAYLLLAD